MFKQLRDTATTVISNLELSFGEVFGPSLRRGGPAELFREVRDRAIRMLDIVASAAHQNVPGTPRSITIDIPPTK